MNTLEKSNKVKKKKKDFYYLKVFVNNGYQVDPEILETGVYACYGYSENAAKKRLTKMALQNIGKAFKSALLVHKPTNTIDSIFTPTHGQEAWEVWRTRKKYEQAGKASRKGNSLLNMSLLLKRGNLKRKELIANNKAPFITFPSMDVDMLTGEYGYHVALNNFIEKLQESKWRYDYVYAKVWLGKKEVAKIDWMQNVEFKCTDFQTIINNLINEST